MKFTIARYGLLAAASVGVLGSTAALAGEGSPNPYVMTVYSDTRHGSTILDGTPEVAISDLMHNRNGNPRFLADLITLCVAYTQTKQIDRAEDACDYAITAAEKQARRSDSYGMYNSRTPDTDRAIALTNRGVLHALNGQNDLAREMFEQAMDLKSREKSAEINLSLLDERTAGSGS